MQAYHSRSHSEEDINLDENKDSVQSAFWYQTQGADELNIIRLSQQSLLSHRVPSSSSPLKRQVTVENDIAEVSLDQHSYSPNISQSALIHDRVHAENPKGYERAAINEARQGQRVSDYFDNLISHYTDAPSTFSFIDNLSIGSRNHTPRARRFCNPYTTALILLTTGFATFTAVYASGMKTKLVHVPLFTSSSSHSLLVLRIVSEVSTVLLWALSFAVMEELQWALAARKKGINVVQFVQLDTGTGFWRLINLLWGSAWEYKATVVIR